jgi:hypothetical protein
MRLLGTFDQCEPGAVFCLKKKSAAKDPKPSSLMAPTTNYGFSRRTQTSGIRREGDKLVLSDSF